MEEKLEKVQGEIWKLQDDMNSTNQVLDVLERFYEMEEDLEIRYCIKVFQMLFECIIRRVDKISTSLGNCVELLK